MSRKQRQQVVIIGGGFGGLKAAESMAFAPVDVTLIDRGGEHLFQPLLYQVATGNLAGEDVTAPLAGVLDRQRNARVVTGEVVDIDVPAQAVHLKDGQTIPYDTLIVATGAGNHYYGRDDEWAALAPSLKTMEDAREMRARIWRAFQAADAEPDLAIRRGLQTFVIVGGGPTGVELAGALGELAHRTLRGEFHNCDTAESEIILLEGLDRVLSGYPAELSAAAEQSLEELGVTVKTGTLVTDITDDYVVVRDVATDEQTLIPTATVLWAAGVKASPLADVVAAQTGASQDRTGRLIVQSDLTLPGHANIFVIGDLANFAGPDGKPLPGVAQVAMQQGDYVADLLRRRRFGRKVRPFSYRDRGNLAVIGRNAAVADIGPLQFAGLPAWMMWAFVHVYFLVEFDDKLKVMSRWAWSYFTRRPGVTLGLDPVERAAAEAMMMAAVPQDQTA